jgi:hypothetical protein
LIRSFFEFEHPRVAFRNTSGELTRTTFHFSKGRTGSIIEPYDQAQGRTVIRGLTGVITDDPLVGWTSTSINVITSHGQPDRPSRFTVGDFGVDIPEIANLDRIEDVSVFNSLKTVGLSSVFSSLWSSNVNDRYTYGEGIYDHLVTEATRKLPLIVDPFGLRRRAGGPHDDRAPRLG